MTAPALLAWLAEAESTCLLEVDEAGTIASENGCLSRALRMNGLAGSSLFEIVDPGSVDLVHELLSGGRDIALVTFVRGEARFSLLCRSIEIEGRLLIVAETPARDIDLEQSLVRANNDLAVLAREHARQHVELEQAIAARERSEWTLRRIGEVMPVCLACGSVDDGSDDWPSVIRFLTENGVSLSHGYCPPCGTAELAKLQP